MQSHTKSAFGFGLLLLTIAAFGSAHGAYLDTDGPPLPEPRGPLPPIVRPVPPPFPRDNALQRLVRSVDVDRPYNHGGMVVYPLVLRSAWEGNDFLTLDEAMSRDLIVIRELDAAQVAELMVRNDSRRYVFLMAGEILAGGRQDRIIRTDSLLEPRSEFVRIPVYCGEKERWLGARESFESPKYLADQALRNLAAKSASQGAIWSQIDEKLSRAEVAAPTRSYKEIYRDREMSRRVDDYATHFRGIPGRRTVGAVLVSRGRILSCDLFGDADLFAKLWDKICRSHALDAALQNGYRQEKRVLPPAPGADEVQRFLNNALSADFACGDTPGAGESWRISGSVEGNALIWRDRVVHGALFPARYAEPMDERPWLRNR